MRLKRERAIYGFQALFAAIVLLSGALLGTVFLYFQRQALADGMDRTALEVAGTLGTLMADDILLEDRYRIADQLGRTQEKNPDILYIIVTYPDGRPLASTFPSGFPAGLPLVRSSKEAGTLHYDSSKGSLREVLYPIDEGMTGYLRIGISEERARTTLRYRAMAFLLALLVVTVLSSLLAVRYRRLLVELAKKERGRLYLLRRLFSAREDERQRISRELHDETSQSMVSILTYIGLLGTRLKEQGDRQLLGEIRSLVATSLAQLRSLAVSLHPPMLDELGLVAALEKHIETLRRGETDPAITLRAEGELAGFSRMTELVCYRTVQEALANAIRHGKARHIDVSILGRPEDIEVRIADDGVGFTEAGVRRARREGHIGLVSMQERAELLSGTFAMRKSAAGGTEILVTLPRQQEE